MEFGLLGFLMYILHKKVMFTIVRKVSYFVGNLATIFSRAKLDLYKFKIHLVACHAIKKTYWYRGGYRI